ncbi:hypothetical protein M1Q06_15300 [Planococcus sp. 11815]|uniref:hypothetical protein n=1 Tax=Planococcus sp. 11815 TaxID=2939413 RepID=UPI003DA45926
MKDRIILVIVLASVLGSSAVSVSSLSYTMKSICYALAASIMVAVGIHALYAYMKTRKIEKSA